MRITRLVIDNYRFALIVFLLVTVTGVYSFLHMPRTENPEMDFPGTTVYAIYPGANPFDMEQLVVIPIEDAVNEIEDINFIETVIRDGLASITVEFDFGTNSDDKYEEVVQKINAIRGDLPDDLYELRTFQWTVTSVAMLQIALVSDNSDYSQLRTAAEALEKQLKKVDGVKKINLVACPDREVRISMDFEKMALLKIPVDQVIGAIQSHNANIPGGRINTGSKTFNIITSGAYENLDEIRNTVVHSANGKILHLRDVADVEFAYEDDAHLARFKQEKAVWLVVEQKEGRNVFDTWEGISSAVETYRDRLDPGIKIEYVFNQANEVSDKINSFLSNLLQGIILVGLVVLLAIGIRSSLIVILAIPLSVVIGLSIIDVAGYGLQQISIAGLVVALGLLVDNGIVMIENINRFVEKGMPPRQAALAAAGEIGFPIISATITTVLAFIPIMLIPDEVGVFIRSLPFTIIATLLVSLLLALTLTPYIAVRTFKPVRIGPQRKSRGVKRLLENVSTGHYRRSLKFALEHKVLVLVLAPLILVGSLALFPSIGFSLFPKAEKPQFMIQLSLEEGADLQATDKLVNKVEGVLDTIPEVDFYASNTGHGNPRIYYNVISKSYYRNYGEVFVQLKEYDVDQFYALIEELRALFRSFAGARIYVKEFEQGPPITAPIMVYISGEKLEVLRHYARGVEGFLQDFPGTINVENELQKERTDLLVDIKKEKANLLGIPIHETDRMIRMAVNGMDIDQFRDEDGKEYDMVVRMPEGDSITTADLERIHVRSMSGAFIPLTQIADISYEQAPGTITRYNRERTAVILADLEKGYTLDDALEPLQQTLEDLNIREDYEVILRGEYESRNESFGGMTIAIIAAMLTIFAVLVLQFRSFSQPLIIYSAIPLAVVGSIWALYITGYTFSFTAFVGLTSLVGIVINNSIILVDYANQLRQKGYSLLEAIQIAGETRMTPIVLTMLTTVGGLLPLTLRGGSLWAPMGWTIIGGLFVSTFLTLLVVPVLYRVFTRD